MRLIRRAVLSIASFVLAPGSETAGSIPGVDPEREEVTQETLEAAVWDIAPDDAILTLRFSDGTYYAPTPDALGEVTGVMTATAALPYRPQVFDCEDYTATWYALTALVTGVNARAMVIDWAGAHAYNIIVDATGEAHLVDPQSGATEPIDGEQYTLEHALVVF